MKKRLLTLCIIALLASGCALLRNKDTSTDTDTDSETETETETSTDTSTEGGDPSTVDSIQDVNILHAWNWKLNDVRSRLSAIKNAGYGAVQLSPMQPKVDKNGYSNNSTKS